MSEEIKTKTDLTKGVRVATKVLKLLQRRTSNLSEMYLASKIVTLFLETHYKLRMQPDEEKRIVDLIKDLKEMK